jgi:hypothetical protein
MKSTNEYHGIRLKTVGYKYTDLFHHEGAVIWWYSKGRFHKVISTGTEMHYELGERLGIEMGSIFRGRYYSRVVTIQPPLNQYYLLGNRVRVPQALMKALRGLGVRQCCIDTPSGLRVMEMGVKSKGIKTGLQKPSKTKDFKGSRYR